MTFDTDRTKRAINNRYIPNREIKVDKYSLSITNRGTVYWISGQGNRKLDSLFQRNVLQIVLPNNETVKIFQNKDGLLAQIKKGEEVTIEKKQPQKEFPGKQ